MSILVVNAGSSSVKFGLFAFDTLDPGARGMLDWAGEARRATMTWKGASGEVICRELDAPSYRAGMIHALEMLGDPALLGKTAGRFAWSGTGSFMEGKRSGSRCGSTRP